MKIQAKYDGYVKQPMGIVDYVTQALESYNYELNNTELELDTSRNLLIAFGRLLEVLASKKVITGKELMQIVGEYDEQKQVKVELIGDTSDISSECKD